MKNLLLFLLLSSFKWSYAQPVLYGEEFRMKNSTYEVVTGPLLIQNAGQSGPDVKWDFSNLNGTAETEDISSQVPLSRFPANRRIKLNDGAAFYLSTNNELSLVGNNVGLEDVNYTIPLSLAQFPLAFNEEFQGSLAGTVSGNLIPFSIRSGEYYGIYDGYGTLKLPDGEYNEVFRVKTTVDTEDLPLARQIRTTRYTWFVKGSPRPVLQLNMNEENIFGFYIPTGGSFKYVKSNYIEQLPLGKEAILKNEEVSIYPIPASQYINLETSSTAANIQVFNAKGQLVEAIETENQENRIDCSTWSNGVYTIHIATTSGLMSKSVVISK